MIRMGLVHAAFSLALASTLLGQEPTQRPVELEPNAASEAGSFGLEDQELFVPATDFEPLSGDWVAFNTEGYWTVSPAATTVATLDLPAGAQITNIACYFYRLPGVSSGTTTVKLAKHIYDLTTNTPSVTFPGSTIESQPIDFAHTDSGPFAETVRYRVGFLRFFYQLKAVHGTVIPFRGCTVIWHQQVSTAPVSATFTDVPTTHPYYRFVEALFASGITAGCSPTQYCVNAPITRGEMAVFLAAALGLHFPN